MRKKNQKKNLDVDVVESVISMDVYLIVEKVGMIQGDHKVVGVTFDVKRARAMGKDKNKKIIKIKGEMLNEYLG